MKHLLKKLAYPEYRKQYWGICAGCGRRVPLVELQPDPKVRDAVRRYISGEKLDFSGSNLDESFCKECFSKRFGAKEGTR